MPNPYQTPDTTPDHDADTRIVAWSLAIAIAPLAIVLMADVLARLLDC